MPGLVEKTKMITEIITFWGIVQGVGFRPTLSRIAAKYRMRGQVRNMGAFVQLIVTDEPERIDAFVEAVQAGKPRMADIMRVDREVIDTVLFEDFRIVSSAAAEDEIAAVPADVAVCDECFAEFRDAANPRYKHPFISCVNCGPRYTIMESLPYDRDTTTMEDFPMCGFCEEEYTDPASRRYHAQTVSCNNCGPQAIWQATPNQNPRHKSNEQSEAQEHKRDGSFCAIHARQGERSDEADAQDRGTVHLSREHKRDEHKRDGSFCAIDARQGELSDEAGVFEAIDAVGSGGVIALKGVGGYYFVCSPYDENAVRKLREIKVREYKPFAVMFASVEQTREYCEIGPEEEAMLTSPKCPIVLLERRQYKGDGSFCTVRSDGTQERKEESPFDRPAKRAGIRTACSTSPWDIPLP
ncbi:MAG: Sua5/YciO/YrdC/YwlC family protein, partial [Clostridiales Family XIII bacterium]|nr:Sua5/YciO/YrdC/YwlC family protein [Clostridiales Family XIII bacterium]